jgi:hypothetical protein
MIVNTHSFHNLHILYKAVPSWLIKPVEKFVDWCTKHKELAARMRREHAQRCRRNVVIQQCRAALFQLIILRPLLSPFSIVFFPKSLTHLFPCIMTESPSPFNIETWRRRNERRVSATSSVITPSETSRVSGERTHQQAFSDCVGCLVIHPLITLWIQILSVVIRLTKPYHKRVH